MTETGYVSLSKVRARLPSWARDGILSGYRGSIAHGSFVPSTEPSSVDDVDVFQVVVQSPTYYLGLDSWNRRYEHFETAGEPVDILVYDIRKFVALLVKGNPNVHAWLWSRPEHYLVRTNAGEILIANRSQFLSQRLIESLGGYAAAQIRRMTAFSHQGYMGEKRKKLVEEHGYDCKNAAHCIRLLQMGTELLTDGELNVHRTHDRGLILDVKGGYWSLDEVKAYVENKFAAFEQAREKHRAQFPEKVDFGLANRLLIATMQRHWELQGDRLC